VLDQNYENMENEHDLLPILIAKTGIKTAQNVTASFLWVQLVKSNI
jgi:hypothetical protein